MKKKPHTEMQGSGLAAASVPNQNGQFKRSAPAGQGGSK